VVPDKRRPPAQQAREDPISNGGSGPVRFAVSCVEFMSISEEKKQLRREAEHLRHGIAQAEPNAAKAFIENFLGAITPKTGAIISGYIPARGEANPLPLMERLKADGHPLALARVAQKAQPMQFHLWRDNAAPLRSAFGVMEPAADWPSCIPDILLVPMLAFDKEGYRLGYGGGFHDRTLQSLRPQTGILAVGIAFAGQEMMILPHDEHDEKLDWIVTEKFARKFERN
jgi:5-formyltetrahydrofolate cyclo-ligase